MKKIIGMIGTLVMLLAVCGCGSGNIEPTAESENPETTIVEETPTDTEVATTTIATETIAIEDFSGKEIIFGAIGNETISNNIVEYLCSKNINNIVTAESTPENNVIITTNEGITYRVDIVDNDVSGIVNLTDSTDIVE